MEIQVQRIPRQIHMHRVLRFDQNRTGALRTKTLNLYLLLADGNFQILGLFEDAFTNSIFRLGAVSFIRASVSIASRIGSWKERRYRMAPPYHGLP
jgi:hypothetical protein